MDEYINIMKDFFEDQRFMAMFHPVVDFNTMNHEVTDDEIMNETLCAIKKGFKFTPVSEYLSSETSFCYAMKENRYVVDVDLTVSKCTATNEPFSMIGKIDECGELILNSYANIWKGARISSKCKSCNYYASCAGGACPLYYLKKGEARCMKFRNLNQKLNILKIADLQSAYDVYLHL